MGLLLAVAALRLPRPIDFTAEIRSFAAVESKALATYRVAMAQGRNKKLSDDKVADLIQKGVLPDWEAERRRLAALSSLPPAAQGLRSALLKYMDARQEGWSLLAQGLRTHDITLAKAGAAKEQNADVLAAEIAAQSAASKSRTGLR